MMETTVPWGELALRAVVIYGVLLVLVRLSGKRTMGQFSPFDLLVMLLLSESVSNGLSGGEESLIGGLFLATILIALNYTASVLTTRSHWIKRTVEGLPTVIGRDGRLDPRAMRREHVTIEDVERQLREDSQTLDGVELVLLETDGTITFVCRRENADGDEQTRERQAVDPVAGTTDA